MADVEVKTEQTTKNYKRPNKKPTRKRSDDHILRKRQPRKVEEGDNIFYINSKTNTKANLERCNQLIRKNNASEIIIYCMGAAIQRGILLALQICEEHVFFKIHTETFTTELIDDLEPAADDADYEIQKRYNSALRIKVFRADSIVKTDNNN